MPNIRITLRLPGPDGGVPLREVRHEALPEAIDAAGGLQLLIETLIADMALSEADRANLEVHANAVPDA